MNASLILALTAGMIAAINPCGFSLLPAYIAVFVTGDRRDATLGYRVYKGARSAVLVTLGFIVVFVTLGVLLQSLATSFRPYLPWVSLVVGLAVVVAGFAVVFGWKLRIRAIPMRASEHVNSASMIGYGVLYALASLSCTLGPFLAITAFALDQSFVLGVASYTSYAVGMGTVIFLIAAAAALARPGPIRDLRKISRYAPRLGGLVMIVSGLYAVWYARWELAVYHGDLRRDRFVEAGERLRSSVSNAIETVGSLRIAFAVAALLFLVSTTVWRASYTNRKNT